MMTRIRTLTRPCRGLAVCTFAALVLAILELPPLARAEERAGVVTLLLGTATITRAALPAPASLGFKDSVFLRDQIKTAEKSTVRVLLGGKATVTARERSVLTITEVPATSIVSLTTGRMAVAVSKTRMSPGETIEIKTPNAVAAVRGTLVIAEVSPGRSTITILSGVVEVTKLDPATGRRVGPAVKVGARERVAVPDAGPVPAPEAITPEAVKRLASDFTFVPKDAPAGSLTALKQAVTQASIVDATQAVSGIATPGISTLTGGASPTAAVGAVSGAAGTVATIPYRARELLRPPATVTPVTNTAASGISTLTGGASPTAAAGAVAGAAGTVTNTATPDISALTSGASPTAAVGAVSGAAGIAATIPTVTNTATPGISTLTGGASPTAAVGVVSGAASTVATIPTGSVSALGLPGTAVTGRSLPATSSPLIPTVTNTATNNLLGGLPKNSLPKR